VWYEWHIVRTSVSVLSGLHKKFWTMFVRCTQKKKPSMFLHDFLQYLHHVSTELFSSSRWGSPEEIKSHWPRPCRGIVYEPDTKWSARKLHRHEGDSWPECPFVEQTRWNYPLKTSEVETKSIPHLLTWVTTRDAGTRYFIRISIWTCK